QAGFYAEVTRKIKQTCSNLWVLLETNGFGLTPKNLDLFEKAGLDAYWLDIKAFDADIYKKLCGTSNKTVVNAPKEIKKRNFILEILTVYIPEFIEIDQFKKIAELIVEVDDNIPFHILAFFPQYKLKNFRSPTLEEIIETYKVVKDIGLKEIQIGNVGVFASTEEKVKQLIKSVGANSF
ncbi:MAG: radical SAM protein, partial [Promethearchaeota archaeon]